MKKNMLTYSQNLIASLCPCYILGNILGNSIGDTIGDTIGTLRESIREGARGGRCCENAKVSKGANLEDDKQAKMTQASKTRKMENA